ncbi:hypothetical protein ACFYTC_37410 [Actinomadura nitritigenes]|uniref:hypothetical protein n=1 Tax=Actinomadura nitritigenes TaxID=134602 RepID=UPI0036B827E1
MFDLVKAAFHPLLGAGYVLVAGRQDADVDQKLSQVRRRLAMWEGIKELVVERVARGQQLLQQTSATVPTAQPIEHRFRVFDRSEGGHQRSQRRFGAEACLKFTANNTADAFARAVESAVVAAGGASVGEIDSRAWSTLELSAAIDTDEGSAFSAGWTFDRVA